MLEASRNSRTKKGRGGRASSEGEAEGAHTARQFDNALRRSSILLGREAIAAVRRWRAGGAGRGARARPRPVREGHFSVDTMMLGEDLYNHNPTNKSSNRHQMITLLDNPIHLRRKFKRKTIDLHHSAPPLKQKERIAGRSSPCLLRKESSNLKIDQKLNQLKKD